MWNFGSLLAVCLIIQIVTGVTLAMHYNPSVLEAFNSVEHIMRDVNNGWLIRYLHSNTASAFFFLVYCHIGRNLYYGSYRAPRTMVYTIGIAIFLLMIVTAFLGYVLPYGQMSLWGATVITNLMSAIPWIGQDVVEFIWGGFSVNNATLNRFFALHFVLPFVLAALVLMHMITLHDKAGSGNPLGIGANYDRITFAPYFLFKDLITIFVFIIVLSLFVFFMPNALGDSENYVKANPMQTPPAIVPEWYLLPFYAILRSIPNKLLGVIAMIAAILILLVMPFADVSKYRGIQFRPLSKIAYYVFIANFLVLMQLGAKHVESPFIEFGQISTVLYFAHFLIIVPSISLLENSFIEYYTNSAIAGKEGQTASKLLPVKPFAFAKIANKESVNGSNVSVLRSDVSLWTERWFWSSNAKDIGTLYLIFALFSGLLGTAFSVLIRLELSGPGVQYIADNQLYNSIITAHAILMIFFMVDKWRLFNHNFHTTSQIYNNQNNNILITDDSNNNNNQNDNKNKIPEYTKVYVENPYANRKLILKVAKNKKGVYVWEDDKHAYVGHSINLYNRISSYFMPSILNTKARRVLRYFNKHGFTSVNLTIYIVDQKCTFNDVVKLEQYFIDTLKPSLNVDLVASSSGYHQPMSQKIRDKLRKQRGTPIYIYSSEDFTLLYVFESKQLMYDTINIHHKTLSNCLDSGDLFLDSFFFSMEIIEESDKTNLLNIEEITQLISNKRKLHNVKHPSSKAILAKFKGDSSKDLEFSSLNSLANHLKGDRQTIREYLKGEKPGYYRGKWEFTYKD